MTTQDATSKAANVKVTTTHDTTTQAVVIDASKPGTNGDASKKPTSELLSFDEVMKRLETEKPHDVYRWLGVFRMPAQLIEGRLKFDAREFDEWLKGIGGVEQLKRKDAQVLEEAQRKAAQRAGGTGAGAASA